MTIYKVLCKESGDYEYSDYGYPQEYHHTWFFKCEENAKRFFDEKTKSIREFLNEHVELFDRVDEMNIEENEVRFDACIKSHAYSDNIDEIWPFSIDGHCHFMDICLEMTEVKTED